MKELPLKGYRITDLGWVAAAPLLTCLLADMGAEVIKVESRKRLDTSRFTPDNNTRDPDRDPWFHSMNRGKLGITVDFSQPKGVGIIRRLVNRSDIIVENFSPGVLKKYGLDYLSLRASQPNLIMISLSATGQEGPLSHIVTYGPSLNGLAGIDSMVGYQGERVLGMQQAFADMNAALHGALAVLVALWHREETGEGQYIDLAQIETLLSTAGEAILDFTMNKRALGTIGNRSVAMAPHNNYPCKGIDKWVSIAISSNEEWQRFCEAVGNPEWSREKKFSDPFARIKNRKELDECISDWTKEHTDYEIMEVLQSLGVAAMPCMDIEERYFDPHFQAREVFVSRNSCHLGTFFMTNTPWKMGTSDFSEGRLAPIVGEHNYYVLENIIGMTRGDIDQLIEEGVLY